jgi:hypothetical protein
MGYTIFLVFNEIFKNIFMIIYFIENHLLKYFFNILTFL